jgi:murein DD-endopeptidase MepM/ murein hydrolase activator NlpD
VKRVVLAIVFVACVIAHADAQAPAGRGRDIVPPDSAGIPTQVLATASGNHGRWYGTYGRGILVRESSAGACRDCYAWRQLAHRAGDSTGVSFDFVNAIAFGRQGEVWYGTVGNGWGLSLDNGRTWKNWEFAQLGPEWQYVAPSGIVVRGDTVVIGTADGLQVTTDDGAHWMAIGDSVGPAARGPADTAIEVLPSEYVLAVKAMPGGWMITHLHGSTWLDLHGCLQRAHGRAAAPCVTRNALRTAARPTIVGLVPVAHAVAGSAKGWAPWFARPIAAGDNDRPDQTYRWGSTMGGSFQAHQGIEFNNPDGTPVHAIGDGTVVYAGRAEAGALTVGIRHDTMLTVGAQRYFVFSTYYHNSALLVKVGDRVTRGEVISRVGNTGRATNDHMHLEVHASPTDSIPAIIDSLNRFPPYTTNPELWIAPLPGTGVIAGTVVDAAGQPIPQARVYGIRKPLPAETPFAYAETYGPHNRPHPLYGEQFAISDVPAGTQHLFVVIDGKRIVRIVVVRPGAMSWVEFRP